ncbi:conserved hypothetical protein [Leptospira interrogans serovar Manilae]|uniref:Uncharacterized protein n=1 Tax=Leptospira interrogans serovar Manilae TaxID=214675 RepID=A0AAQ1SPZ1_LEPIR|nr:conserved hypothetical protein [Leptospira interrogans serovar Manilae]
MNDNVFELNNRTITPVKSTLLQFASLPTKLFQSKLDPTNDTIEKTFF